MTNLLKRDLNGCMTSPRITAEQIKSFRKKLGLTQEEFAKEFNIPLGTLRDWEQGTRNSAASRMFAIVLPELMRKTRAQQNSAQNGLNPN